MTEPDGMRLEQLREDTLTIEQRSLADAIAGHRPGASLRSRNLADAAGRIQGPFNHMLHVPALGDPVQQLGGVLRFAGTLPDRARELVILTVAQAWESDFEWWAHVRIARDIGLTDGEIHAVARGDAPVLEDPVERAALDGARALVARSDLTDEEYARTEAVLGPSMLIELTTLVGYYALLAMQMRVFRVAAPDDAEPAFTRRSTSATP
jgi:4-carboxymuconolactone decarboxylase